MTAFNGHLMLSTASGDKAIAGERYAGRVLCGQSRSRPDRQHTTAAKKRTHLL
jgi:hypothetical protein